MGKREKRKAFLTKEDQHNAERLQQNELSTTDSFETGEKKSEKRRPNI